MLIKKILLTGVAFSLISLAKASDLTPITNLDTLKQEIVIYHESGAYLYDVKKMADQALTYIRKRVKENKTLTHPKKLAIVLDIDETSISNYKDLKRLGFGGTAKMQNDAE